jgi:hypothetical protein
MKGFHLNPDEGNEVVPACEDDDKLKLVFARLCAPKCGMHHHEILMIAL